MSDVPESPSLWLVEPVRIAAVMAGGAFGSVARYAVSRLSLHWYPTIVESFPWHTFFVNVLGSFILGLLAVWFKSQPHHLVWWLLFGTGFCGGFTTFSTFSLETLSLLEKDRPFAALGYVGGSVMLGLAAAWLAVKLSRIS